VKSKHEKTHIVKKSKKVKPSKFKIRHGSKKEKKESSNQNLKKISSKFRIWDYPDYQKKKIDQNSEFTDKKSSNLRLIKILLKVQNSNKDREIVTLKKFSSKYRSSGSNMGISWNWNVGKIKSKFECHIRIRKKVAKSKRWKHIPVKIIIPLSKVDVKKKGKPKSRNSRQILHPIKSDIEAWKKNLVNS